MNKEANLTGINFTQSEQCTLSVHLCMDAFFFSVYNPLRSSHFSFMRCETDETLSLTANVKQIFESHEFLNRPFKRVNIVLETDRYTLIPFELFEDDQAEELFAYSHTSQDNEKILHRILPKCNVAILFGMDRFTYSWLTDRYPKALFCCQIAPLAEYFCSKNRVTDTSELYTVIQENTVNVLGFNRGGVILTNTFHYLSAEDLTYYLLSVWQQLELQPHSHPLFLHGESSHRKAAEQILQKFLRHVESPELPATIFGAKQPEQSFTLQALYLCE